MIQCETCKNRRSFKDHFGKEHFTCRASGARSSMKWKKNECLSYKLKENQSTLEVLIDARE